MEWSSVKKKKRNRIIKFRFYQEFTIKKPPKNKKTKQQAKINKKEIQLTKYKE